jgi:hypothetical protein
MAPVAQRRFARVGDDSSPHLTIGNRANRQLLQLTCSSARYLEAEFETPAVVGNLSQFSATKDERGLLSFLLVRRLITAPVSFVHFLVSHSFVKLWPPPMPAKAKLTLKEQKRTTKSERTCSEDHCLRLR